MSSLVRFCDADGLCDAGLDVEDRDAGLCDAGLCDDGLCDAGLCDAAEAPLPEGALLCDAGLCDAAEAALRALLCDAGLEAALLEGKPAVLDANSPLRNRHLGITAHRRGGP